MFDTNTIIGLIREVYGAAKKENEGKNNPLAAKVFGLVEDVFDTNGIYLSKEHTKAKTPKMYVNAKKGAVVYWTGKKEFTATCMVGDTFDRNVGASLCLGYAEFGSKGKYHKALKQFANNYLNGLDLPYEQASVMYYCNKFGGRDKFVAHIDELFVGSSYEDLISKYTTTETE